MLKQRACVIWFTGLSGSGKTTLAIRIAEKLFKMGFLCQTLDSDKIRLGLNNNLGFTDEGRVENIRRVAEVSKILVECGVISINSFISPTVKIRKMARDIIGNDDFVEIYLNASFDTCEKRDVKGLYKAAREGKIKYFTGIDSPYEVPENPEVEIDTDNLTIEESVAKCIEYVLKKINNRN